MRQSVPVAKTLETNRRTVSRFVSIKSKSYCIDSCSLPSSYFVSNSHSVGNLRDLLIKNAKFVLEKSSLQGKTFRYISLQT